jgi:hypothetical protein
MGCGVEGREESRMSGAKFKTFFMSALLLKYEIILTPCKLCEIFRSQSHSYEYLEWIPHLE